MTITPAVICIATGIALYRRFAGGAGPRNTFGQGVMSVVANVGLRVISPNIVMNLKCGGMGCYV